MPSTTALYQARRVGDKSGSPLGREFSPAAQARSALASVAVAPPEPLDETLQTIDRSLGARGRGLGALRGGLRARRRLLRPTRGRVLRPSRAGEEGEEHDDGRGPAHPWTVGAGEDVVKRRWE